MARRARGQARLAVAMAHRRGSLRPYYFFVRDQLPELQGRGLPVTRVVDAVPYCSQAWAVRGKALARPSPLRPPAGGNGFGLRQLNGGEGRGEACGAALLQPQRAGAVGYAAARLPFADGEPALIRWIRVVPLCGLCVGQNVSVAFLGG